jgi:predicted glycosyltransferase
MRRRPLSQMTTAEKAAQLGETLADLRETMARQERMMAELRRRLDPNAPKRPKLGLRTVEEVMAYVDRIADGSEPGSG